MKEKVKVFIIVGFALIMLLLIIMIAIKINEGRNSYQYEVMGVHDETQDLIPNLEFIGINELSTISVVSNEKIKYAKKIEKIFEEELPMIYKDFTSKDVDVSEYYKTNEILIKEMLYNIDEENFKELIEKMKLMKSNFEKEFDICTIKKNKDQTSVDIICAYENGESIELNLNNRSYLIFVK